MTKQGFFKENAAVHALGPINGAINTLSTQPRDDGDNHNHIDINPTFLNNRGKSSARNNNNATSSPYNNNNAKSSAQKKNNNYDHSTKGLKIRSLSTINDNRDDDNGHQGNGNSGNMDIDIDQQSNKHDDDEHSNDSHDNHDNMVVDDYDNDSDC